MTVQVCVVAQLGDGLIGPPPYPTSPFEEGFVKMAIKKWNFDWTRAHLQNECGRSTANVSIVNFELTFFFTARIVISVKL